MKANAELSPDLLKKLAKRTGMNSEQLAARSWLRLDPEHVHVANSIYGTEAWVSRDEYASAEPNPLAEDLSSVMRAHESGGTGRRPPATVRRTLLPDIDSPAA